MKKVQFIELKQMINIKNKNAFYNRRYILKMSKIMGYGVMRTTAYIYVQILEEVKQSQMNRLEDYLTY